MSNFYNVFGQFVSTQMIETFVSQDDKIDNTKILNNIKVLKVQIENGTITKEQIITEIEKLNSLKMNKDTSDEVKNAIELLVKDTVSKVDGIKLEGNMELTGVMKSRGFYLTDGTKVNEVTRVVDKLAIPLDKEGHLTILPPKGKKVTINDLNVTSNTGLKVTGHGKTSSFGSLNSGWCHITTNAPNFYMNKSLSINGGITSYHNKAINVPSGINATGGRSHFKDAENKGRVRVGAAWGIPGFYSEDNQDIVVGVPSAKKVNLGTAGKFVEITGTGNMKVPGNVNTPLLSRIGGDWLRINQQDNSVGRVATYGGFSINDTRAKQGGLSVGSWAPPGQGNITATGQIKAGKICINNTCITEEQLKSMLLLSDQRPKDGNLRLPAGKNIYIGGKAVLKTDDKVVIQSQMRGYGENLTNNGSRSSRSPSVRFYGRSTGSYQQMKLIKI
jgi:hypothetical protein